ncbi:MAG: hypothetical protein AAFX53_14915 [Bacteroidota bacterium]
MDYNIWAVLGILSLVYLFIIIYNRRQSRRRRDRKFMDGYGRHKKKDGENE